MRVLWFLAALLCISHFTEACEIEAEGVDDEFKDQIVNKHNELRAKVANGEEGGLPKAANMLEMVWDDELAKKAQEWASKCVFELNEEGDGVGENVATRMDQNDEPGWEDVLQMFFGEEKNFNSDHIGSYEFQFDSGQFTQMIWAETNKVGCGYVRHSDGSNKIHLYGCHYSPGGNIIGQPIYEIGDPCSSCGGCGPIEGLCEKKSRRRRSEDEDEEETDYEEDVINDDDEEGSGLFGLLNGIEADNDDVSDLRGQSYEDDYGEGVDGDDVDIYINDYADEEKFGEGNGTEVYEDDFDIYGNENEDVDVGIGEDYYEENSGDTYRDNVEDNFEEDNDVEDSDEEDSDEEESDEEESDEEESDEEDSDEEDSDEEGEEYNDEE